MIFPTISIKTRVTLFTLSIFVGSIWVLSFYASRMLQADMQRVLGEQQFSTASFIAESINDELSDRLKALETVAARVSSATMNSVPAAQRFLEDRLILQAMFNGGVTIIDIDGTAIADVPRTNGRLGVNYGHLDYVAGILKDGKPLISKPTIGPTLKAPVFVIAVPLRDAQGKLIGGLSGVIRLDKPNFMDKITGNKSGKKVRYVVAAPQHGVNVTASDTSRILAELPAPGINPMMDRFAKGEEGTFVFVNPLGETVLASVKAIPVASWYAAVVLAAEDAFAPIVTMQQRMLLSTILLTLLAGGLIWWMLRRELAPMLRTVNTLTLLATTDQPPQALPITRQDEIGKLIGGFNHLLETLGQRDAALRLSKSRFEEAQNVAHLGHWQLDLIGGALVWSDEVFRLFEIDPHQFGATYEAFLETVHPDDRAAVNQAYTRSLETRTPHEITYRLRMPDGRIKWIYEKCASEFDAAGKPLRSRGIVQDVTERQHTERYEQFRSRTLELLTGNEPLRSLLEAIVRGVEQLHPEMLCSILLLDSEGRHLEKGMAPSLPDFYNAALDGIEIGVGVGSCGTAAFTGERVIAVDIATDPYWVSYKDLAASAGLGSCWSQPIRSSAGHVLGTFAIYHHAAHTPAPSDIYLIEESAKLASISIERRQAEAQLQLAASVFAHAREGIMITTPDGAIIDVNEAFTRITGHTRDDALGQNPRILNSGRHDANYFAAMWQGLIAQGHWSGEIWNRRKNGDIFAEMQTISAVRDATGSVQHYVSLFSDISERKALEDKVHQMAYFDALTGLPNRRLLNDRLSQAMAASKRSGLYGALMFLDLDNFKPLNDSHGHEVGDSLLIEVARRLTECLRQVDTVARFGGDEFVVMLSELEADKALSAEQAGGVAEKIRASLAVPYFLTASHPGQQDTTVEHHCSVSIGVVLFIDHETDQADIMKRADTAMYRAKHEGRNVVRFYQGNS